MRRRLWIFCAIAAVLSGVSFIPGILVIAGFLAGVPLIILSLAPDALLVGIALLIADYLAPRRFPRKAVVTLAMAGLLTILVVAAAWSNRQLDQQIQAFTKDDHDFSGTLPDTRDIGIQFVRNERARQGSPGVSERVQNLRNDATARVIPPREKSSVKVSVCICFMKSWRIPFLCRRFRNTTAILRPILMRSECAFMSNCIARA